MEVKFLQLRNASDPKDSRLVDKVIDERFSQSQFLQLIVCQLDLVKTVEKCLRRFCGGQKPGRFNVFNFL